jgi:actin related protein 2/3 complex subunit 1A/1B
MSAPTVHHLSLGPLTAHAFNADRTRVAVCPNSHEVLIYALAGGAWTLAATLAEHDKLVTSVDWAPHTDRLVTCSQDRNAYVWTRDADAVPRAGASEVWKPTLVLLRLNRAATCVRWSPNEDKFAVASGARLVLRGSGGPERQCARISNAALCVGLRTLPVLSFHPAAHAFARSIISVCSFEAENDWWVAKHIRRPLRSTILSLDWHANNVLLAAGCADMTARVFSAFIKGIDAKPAPSVWGERLPFGTVCGEWKTPAGGWVHGVSFSPDGDALAFVGE